MAQNYNLDTHLEELNIVLQEYTEWFMQVMRHVFYPDADAQSKTHSHPESFEMWIQKAEQEKAVDSAVLKSFFDLHTDLCKQAVLLTDQAQKDKMLPQLEEFDKLAVLFEEFINRARRMERDCLLEDSGIDTLTGLRNKDVLFKDVRLEMDRLERHGKSFVLALVKIDHFHEIHSALGEAKTRDFIVLVSKLAKKRLRTFDDGYFLGDGKFILALKQTAMMGGTKALMRMKAELEDENPTFMLNGSEQKLTLSARVVEPLPSDDVAELIKNLEEDMVETGEAESGAVLETTELSPLQRFIKDSQG